MKQTQINEKVISSTFQKSAGVMIAGSATAFIGTTVDSMITSRMLGVTYVSAFQIVQPLILIIAVLAMLILNGLQNVYAKQIGAGKMKEAYTIMSLSIVVLGVISAICGLLYCLFAHPIVNALGANDSVSLLHKEAVGYIYGIAPGLIGLCLQQLLSQIVIIEGRQNVVLTAVIVQTVVNIVGDVLVATTFHNGLFGMGMASTVCYYSAIAVLLFSMIRKPVSYRFMLKNAKFKSLGEVFGMGLPGAAERLGLMIQTLFMNKILLSQVSADAVAAYAILSTLNNLLQSVSTGTASTTFTMASIYVGEEDKNSLKTTLKSSLRFTGMLECIVLAIVLLAASVMILPFIGEDGAEVQQIAVWGLRLLAVSVPFYGINHTFQRYIQAVGKISMAYLIPTLGSVICFVPSALVLLFTAGGNFIWLAFFAGEFLTTLIVVGITSAKKKQLAVHLDDYLYLPSGMQADATVVIDTSVKDVSELLTLSEECQKYFMEKENDQKKGMLLALAVEEMGNNIFQYNQKNVVVDVRLLKRNQEWILRIRDNGKGFDPKKWVQIHQNDDKTKNIGIRMISGLCRQFEYISIMSMNNLIVHVE